MEGSGRIDQPSQIVAGQGTKEETPEQSQARREQDQRAALKAKQEADQAAEEGEKRRLEEEKKLGRGGNFSGQG